MASKGTSSDAEWAAFFGWLTIYILVSSAAAALGYSWLSASIGKAADLATTIQLTKAVSLAALILIGGAEIVREKNAPGLLKLVNIIVMIGTAAIVGMILIKIIVQAMLNEGAFENIVPFLSTYNVMKQFGNEIAILPLFIFLVLNALSALYYCKVKVNEEMGRSALSFLCVSDIPCIVAISGVFMMVHFIAASEHDIEIFVSGAMAMFIVISNLLVLVVRYIIHPVIVPGVIDPPRTSAPAPPAVSTPTLAIATERTDPL